LAFIRKRIQQLKIFSYIRSTMIALAPPPPLQIAAAPIFAFRCFSTFSSVTTILLPLLPSG
jgi:hypothetical protein